jgi:phosphomannomutase
MSEPIISVSGLRGIIGSELTPVTASKYIAAFCSVLPKGKVVLGRDGRTSGPMLLQAVSATLIGHGMDVLDADVISTPSLGVLVRDQKAVAGIQISASHNPPAYNGLKLFNADGRVIPAVAGTQVLAAYRNGQSRWMDTEQLGTYSRVVDPHRPHLNSVLKTVNVDRIIQCNFRVLLDSNHGAGAMLGRTLLENLGCQLTILGEQPSGLFAHPPEPLAANLATVSDAVKQGGFDVGFCQDPDADRLAVIDEFGHYIGEEFTSVLCVYHRLEQKQGPVVTNCASSSMTAWLAQKYNVPYLRSKVGEANVVDKMLSISAIYGGEGSGGPIDPRVGYVRDSFVGMAQILDFMASRNVPISRIVADLPRTVMIKDKMQLSDQKLKESTDLLQRSLHASQVDTEDGVRLDWEDRWLLLRGSNTEPIVRLIAEAPTEAEANDLILSAKRALGSAAT